MSQQRMRSEAVLVPLNLWPHKLVGSIEALGTVERLAVIFILGTVADWHPSDRLAGVLVSPKTLEVGRDAITRTQFAALIKLPIAYQATRAVVLARGDPFAVAHPLGAWDPFIDHERRLSAHIA